MDFKFLKSEEGGSGIFGDEQEGGKRNRHDKNAGYDGNDGGGMAGAQIENGYSAFAHAAAYAISYIGDETAYEDKKNDETDAISHLF